MTKPLRKRAQIGEAGYQRLAGELYRTPEWVTRVLCNKVKFRGPIWEPACGKGDMVRALKSFGYTYVIGSDIEKFGPFSESYEAWDFLKDGIIGNMTAFDIVTNPPYTLDIPFIEKALELTKPFGGSVAMLLGFEFDAPKTHHYLFKHPAFRHKIVLPSRIRWVGFENKASPRQVHAWYYWNWSIVGQGNSTIYVSEI